MDEESWFLLLFALIAGGAIVITLLAAYVVRDGGTRDRHREAGNEGRDDGPEAEGDEGQTRLAWAEAKIQKLSQLIDITSRDPVRTASGDVIAQERTLLAYLVDVADKSSALLLRRSYINEVGWLLSLLDDDSWIEKSAAFREKIVREHEEMASRPYFEEHPALDEALADILADFDATTGRMIAAETTRLLEDESPITETAILKSRKAEELLATITAELDASFERFVAKLELR